MPEPETTGTRSGPRWVVGTVVARNYIAYARVLEHSVRESSPGIDVVTLLVDGEEQDRSGAGLAQVLLPEDLGLEREVLEPMLVMYTVMELATALKAAFLRTLLNRGYAAAAYLDPDILVLDRLDPVFEAAQTDGVALTPHTLHPVPRDGLEIAERTVTLSGIFNLGFVAVGAGGRAFLDWWHDRLSTDAVVDHARGLFTDQRWVDWVPALFRHRVLRDPGLNVAYWNVHERPVVRHPDGSLTADGAPVRFVHFSGFDLSTPWVLSRFTMDRPRVLLSDAPVLAELCAEYGRRVRAEGHEQRRTEPYGLAEVGGVRLTPEMRAVYREALVGELPFGPPPRRPVSTPEALRRWFSTPVGTTPWWPLAPAELAIWRARSDLRAVMPDPRGASARSLRAWLDGDSSVPVTLAASGLPAVSRPTGSREWGVVIAGAQSVPREIRDVAGRLAAELTAHGVDVQLVEAPPAPGGAPRRWTGPDGEVPGSVRNVVVCVDADRLDSAELALALGDVDGVRVAVWLTARPEAVAQHAGHLAAFDEVWVLTPEIEAAVRAVVPVRTAVLALPVRAAQRRRDGVVVGLDGLADVGAQLPQDLVAAHAAAARVTGPLVLSVRVGDLSRLDAERLRWVLAGHDGVTVEDAASTASSASSEAAVVLSTDPTCPVGLAALDGVMRGAAVVAIGAAPPSLGGEVAGVHLVATGAGLDALTAALVAAAAGPAAPGHERAARPGGAVHDLAASARARGPRPGRTPAPIALTTPAARIAQLEAEVAAHRATRSARWAARLTSALSRMRPRGRPAAAST